VVTVTRRALVAGAAAATGAVLLGACGDDGASVRPSGDPDVALLESQLDVERFSASVYPLLAKRLPGPARDLVATIGAQDAEHVARLETLIRDLGATPSAPKPTVPEATAGPAAVYQIVADIERRQVASLARALPRVSTARTRLVLAGILAVDGEHLAVGRRLLGVDPVLEPFESGTAA
jgi:hypothetical protein